MKRFYTAAEVGSDLGVLLDGRPVRTPARALLSLPRATLAEAVAAEWQAQGAEIDPRSMPLTGLANAVIDHVLPNPADFAASLAAYGESDLLCYRAADPPPLVARQAAVWDPLLDWARSRYDVGFTLVSGIMHQPQPAKTVSRLAEAVAARSAWELAALQPLVTISGSLVIGLGIVERAFEPETAFQAAHLDELWQEELWGADDLALETRMAHRADFMAAARFLSLLD